jgi:hypothetical protein
MGDRSIIFHISLLLGTEKEVYELANVYPSDNLPRSAGPSQEKRETRPFKLFLGCSPTCVLCQLYSQKKTIIEKISGLISPSPALFLRHSFNASLFH